MQSRTAFARKGTDELDSLRQINDVQRHHWNDAAKKELELPNYYQSVAVLMIHWADWLDPELKCGEEVSVLTFVLLC